uniref:Ras family GTPase n=1 Tax=Pithovirus LCPAC401 TaxID=2506595 RepID=A0A481Z9Z4_9VIRU|nr:MAG: Ras family GTPase [Pithovirus LCPAC401]
MENYTHKIVFVGDGGVGKTTFITRHMTGKFEKRYIPTQGKELRSILFSTNKGKIGFDILDIAGQEKFGLSTDYFVGAECAVVMFDVTSLVSYKNAKVWVDLLRKSVPEIPIVLCGNKVDIKNRKVKNITIYWDLELLGYYDISALSNYNFEKPFLAFVRHFYGEDAKLVQDEI